MGVKIVAASEVRQNLKAILEELGRKGEAVYVTQRGRARAVLVDYELYEALLQRLEDLEDVLAMKEALEAPPEESVTLQEFLARREQGVYRPAQE